MKIILYQPDIPQNLGAAMRLCACFGVALEVIEPCGFPLTDKALRRTAMDYGVAETLKRHINWDDFQTERLTPPQFNLTRPPPRLILMTTKGATPLTDFKFRTSDWVLFGRESAGVPENVHKAANCRVTIPIAKTARSFNLVTSASITIFEALRQTGGLPTMK